MNLEGSFDEANFSFATSTAADNINVVNMHGSPFLATDATNFEIVVGQGWSDDFFDFADGEPNTTTAAEEIGDNFFSSLYPSGDYFSLFLFALLGFGWLSVV